MKRIIPFFIVITICLVSGSITLAQTIDWIRVGGDNDEFSIEIPTKYNFLSDKDGFVVIDHSSNNYALKNMYMANAYAEKTLLSFEVYEADQKALNILYEKEKSEGTASEINRDGVKLKQVIKKTAEFYAINWFFFSKKNIYVLTATSREGETPNIKRFLSSLIFKPDSKNLPSQNTVLLSSLKSSYINLVTKNVKPFSLDKNKPKDNDLKPLAFINKPTAFYVDSARMHAVQGTQQVRCVFSEVGFMPNVEFINMLPEGLARQALFAALRIKFLPPEKNGIPQATERVIEYHFVLY